MKAINNYRKSNVYCLNASEVQDMAKILAFFAARNESVSAIGRDSKEHGDWDYTVRATDVSGKKLFDHKVHVTPISYRANPVEILETVLIADWN